MTHSQRKGSQGEREAAAFICSLGFDAVRSKGLGVEDGRDVIIRDLPNVYLEVKRVESLDLGTKQLWDAWIQAYNKAIASLASVTGACVMWRPNGKRAWRLTFYDDKCGFVTVFRDQDIKANLRRLNGGGD
jgi:hypothetical protein